MAISELSGTIKQIVLNELQDIHTMFIAKIINVDNSERTASVELLQKLIKTTQGVTIQTVTGQKDDIPITPIFDSLSFSIWAPYQKDDKVILQISERPLEEPLSANEISEQQKMGRMQIGYGIIMKPIPHDLLDGTQKEADSLFIEHKGSGNYFKFGADGNIEISANVKINGDLEVSGDSTAADHLSSGISGKDHLHSGVTSGSSKTQKPE